MKIIFKLTTLLTFLELTSCRQPNGDLQGASFLRPAEIAINLNSTSTWPGLCHRVQMEFTTSDNTTTSSGRQRTLNFATDLGALYTDVNCTTPLTTHTFSQDDTNFTFYFRSSTTGTANLTATTSGLQNSATTLAVGAATATLTLGQQAFNFNTANFPSLSAQSFDYPSNPVIADNKMFVADYANNRVLIWNSIPTSTQQAADLVLGQPNI